jgi:hypothetical protein
MVLEALGLFKQNSTPLRMVDLPDPVAGDG